MSRGLVTNAANTERRFAPVEHAQRDPITDVDRAVWRHVRDEGGYHSSSEVFAALKLGTNRGPGPLSRLFNRGHLARRWNGSMGADGVMAGGWVYGVTGECLPPDGETLAPGATR